MGRRGPAAWGMAALLIAGLAAAPPAGGAVRVLQAERMTVDGGFAVGVRGAGGGRALALRRNGEARTQVEGEIVRAVVVRSRTSLCRRGVLLVGGSGDDWSRRRIGRRWTRRRVSLPEGERGSTARVRFAGGSSRRCRALLDGVRLHTVPAPAPEHLPPAAARPLRDVPLGTAVTWDILRSDPFYAQALDTHFVSVTPENEMKMEHLQPAEGHWNFAPADALVDYATERGMAVRGHTLIYGEQTPSWVRHKLFSSDAARTMRAHIHQVMKRYAGRVRTWDVVNEAIADNGSYKYNLWLERLGPRYVELAFRYAREADGTARLVYNEANAERANRRRAATFNLVKSLKAKGLIDGVGLQMHTAVGHEPSQAEIEETMRLYESIGVEVEITEMDVEAAGDRLPETLPERLSRQAAIYRSAATVCAKVVACKAMTVWGVGDRFSWKGVEQIPLLLDTEYRPKPAYHAVRSVIG